MKVLEAPFTSWKFSRFALVAMGLFLLCHLFFVKLPPVGNHVWRQSNTLALARNFQTEGMNILQPRVDKRYHLEGVTGTNFPLYEWLLATTYKVIGFHHWVHRVYALIVSLLSFLAMYHLFRSRSELTARVLAFGFLFNPLVFYYGFSALPDMLAILLALLASLMMVRAIQQHRLSAYLLFTLFAAAALMVKFTYALWLLIPVFLVESRQLIRRLPWLALCALLIAIPVYGWYKHANYLTANSGGLVEFVYHARFVSSASELGVLISGLLATLPEMFLGYPALLCLLLVGFTRDKETSYIRPDRWLIVLIVLLALAYVVAASNNLKDHDYYLLPLLGLALMYLGNIPRSGFPRKAFFLLLWLMPVWAYVRVAPPNWHGEQTDKLQAEKQELKKYLKPEDRVICGVDPTGCYLFYMLEVKGFPYDHPGGLQVPDSSGVPYLQRAAGLGARYLITNRSEDLELAGLKEKEVIGIGEGMWLLPLASDE